MRLERRTHPGQWNSEGGWNHAPQPQVLRPVDPDARFFCGTCGADVSWDANSLSGVCRCGASFSRESPPQKRSGRSRKNVSDPQGTQRSVQPEGTGPYEARRKWWQFWKRPRPRDGDAAAEILPELTGVHLRRSFDDESPSRMPTPGRGGPAFDRSREPWNARDYATAFDLLRDAVKEGLPNPVRADAYFSIGYIHLLRGEVKQGVEMMLFALASDNRASDTTWQCAIRLHQIYAGCGRSKEAAQLAELAEVAGRGRFKLESDHIAELRSLINVERKLQGSHLPLASQVSERQSAPGAATSGFFVFDYTVMGTLYGAEAYRGIVTALKGSPGVCSFDDGDVSADVLRVLPTQGSVVLSATGQPPHERPPGCSSFGPYLVAMWTDNSENFERVHDGILRGKTRGYRGCIVLDGSHSHEAFSKFAISDLHLTIGSVVRAGLVVPETQKYGVG